MIVRIRARKSGAPRKEPRPGGDGRLAHPRHERPHEADRGTLSASLNSGTAASARPKPPRGDEAKSYGVFWSNRTRTTRRRVSEAGPNGREYRWRYSVHQKPEAAVDSNPCSRRRVVMRDCRRRER